MTSLERLIKAHTETATVTTVSRTTETVAEEMAREILKDEEFRKTMRALITKHFTQTMAALTREEMTENGKRRRRKNR